jgi:hypothetical protein
MLSLEDINDFYAGNLIEGKTFVVRRALNMYVKMDDSKVKRRIYSIRDVMFIISYVA